MAFLDDIVTVNKAMDNIYLFTEGLSAQINSLKAKDDDLQRIGLINDYRNQNIRYYNRIAVLERALELACYSLNYGCMDENSFDAPDIEIIKEDCDGWITQARDELEAKDGE